MGFDSMIDWLAEQYVVVWTKAVFFVENPTACGWIAFFQATVTLLGAAWLLRTSYASLRGRRVSTRGSSSLWEHSDRVEAAKLRAAFLEARDSVAAISRSRGLRTLDTTRVRIPSATSTLLCNVGYLRPTFLVSRGLIRDLRRDELTAALAHEITHGVRRDNLKRLALEALCLVAPAAVWLYDGLHLAVGSPEEFLAILFLGLAAGLVFRTLALPAIRYWQERRADEWAAAAVGDRLAVASALLTTAARSRRSDGEVTSYPATSFAFYKAPFATRVRRLVESDAASAIIPLDRWLKRAFRATLPAVALLGVLAVHRAESQGLVGVVRVTDCGITLRVERGSPVQTTDCRKSKGETQNSP